MTAIGYIVGALIGFAVGYIYAKRYSPSKKGGGRS